MLSEMAKKKVTELLVNQSHYCQGFCHQLLILLAHELEGSLIKLHWLCQYIKISIA